MGRSIQVYRQATEENGCQVYSLWMCPDNAICVLILLYVSSYCYMCPHTSKHIATQRKKMEARGSVTCFTSTKVQILTPEARARYQQQHQHQQQQHDAAAVAALAPASQVCCSSCPCCSSCSISIAPLAPASQVSLRKRESARV